MRSLQGTVLIKKTVTIKESAVLSSLKARHALNFLYESICIDPMSYQVL
jgi:hypothetical protein